MYHLVVSAEACVVIETLADFEEWYTQHRWIGSYALYHTSPSNSKRKNNELGKIVEAVWDANALGYVQLSVEKSNGVTYYLARRSLMSHRRRQVRISRSR